MRIKPKKSLGQNFLVDKNIQRKIIEACEFKATDIILEIGAGTGALTKLIADKVKKLYAIELDFRCHQILNESLNDYSNIVIIKQDILKFGLKRYFGKSQGKIKVVGNIPYYITTPIIEHLLNFKEIINSIFITVQKEFAKRMIAKPHSKDYGSFSCFLQYYTEPKILFLIKKASFFPAPKVDSCFLRLDIKQKTALGREKEKLFFRIIRAAFNQRRKTLRNSLQDTIPPESLAVFFNKYNINPNIRPEDLSLEDFANLVRIQCKRK